MKKFFKVTLALVILVTSVSMLISCSDSDPIPADVINDGEGIKIDLEWSIAGGTAADAQDAADLDLKLYDGVNIETQSASYDSFERITLDPEDLADGTYTIAVYLWDSSKDVNYVVTVNGQSVTKPITFNSNFVADDSGRRVDALTLTKSGSKYTVKEIN